ncbi:DUF2169 domain-containing protein [Janthinobacterium sp. BJB1]|uniref:DUF2169 family type VI secretion system accessory protein n=1 Tax=Janthinobacterium sp. GW458P TaxID=1981504 RepID=UPI000A325E05|nr:DUF2169 domain-containing protein [Janthinobacterium sp. GW458P]MBE3026214.1 DUF2169 domain-containing protein [Janthinobacterium sp. GW458P]PHV17413.1 DUF2169 domain-containing protein [Janthinobacterium sp. BJB303]PJC98737.1 DUF2169 domain-containing protein [Janthinobacterium sp. BJB1]
MNDAGTAHFNIPNLLFDNRTPHAASQFDMVDQFGAAFHVVVARMGYTFGPCGADGVASLLPMARQSPLATEDRHLHGDTQAGTVQESDFAPYKPRCDVIVNGMAHAPRGQAMPQFLVNLKVRSEKKSLIDKTLQVCGERAFRKKAILTRLAQGCARIATAGLLRPNPWYLSTPEPFLQLPLHYACAYGGQCRIEADDCNAAKHDSCQANPLGLGFARHWYLDGKHIDEVPAPRITQPSLPCTAAQFWQGAGGKELPAPAGLAAIGRGWLPRRALAGHIVEKDTWGADEVPLLPEDFDFAYWNSTPPDQQCPHLAGLEQFTLTNLCRHDHPSARIDPRGNTVLRFALPQQVMCLLLADKNDQLLVWRLAIDTVLIAPEAASVELVWRAIVPADAGQVASRLLHVMEPAQIARIALLEQAQEALGKAAGQGQNNDK